MTYLYECFGGIQLNCQMEMDKVHYQACIMGGGKEKNIGTSASYGSGTYICSLATSHNHGGSTASPYPFVREAGNLL